MSLVVGSIVARIEADLASYDQKMAGAARTFEQTAGKMQAASQSATTTIQKSYADRIVAANQSAQREIDAAARAMRERLRMTQTSGEVAALRKIYNERVAAARAGAAAEIQALQQAHLAASQGMRPAIDNLEAIGRTATRAAPGINTIRGSFASLITQLTPLPPQVATVTSVLGSFAIGSAWMTGVLAGIAGVAFAVGKLTEKWRENRKETKEAIDELARAAKERALGPEGLVLERATKARAEVSRLMRELQNASTTRTIQGGKPGETLTILPSPALVAKLQADLAKAVSAVAEAWDQIGDIKKEASEDQLREAEQAASEAARRRREQFEREMAEMRAHFSAKMRLFREHMADWARTAGMVQTVGGWNPGISTKPVGRGATMIQGRGAVRAQAMPDFRMIRTVEPLSAPGIRVAARGQGHPLDFLKAQFDAKQIIAGIASSGISALVGAATNFATGLLTQASRAREALRLQMQAFADWHEGIRASIARLKGDTESERLFNFIADVRKEAAGFAETFGLKFFVPLFKNMEELNAWIARIDLIFAPWFSPEQREAWEQFKEYARLSGEALGKTAEAAKAVTEALTNVPTGFKIALRRFNATEGLPDPRTLPWGIPPIPPPRPPFEPPWAAGSAARGGLTIIVNGASAQSGQELLEIIEREAVRKQARGGSSLVLGYL